MRYLLNAPTTWAFDISYIMYGTLFMMGGAYTLSRGGHVRGDFIYRLWKPRTQAKVELVLYFMFFFPGVLALIFAGWRYAGRSWRYLEVSVNEPGRRPGLPVQDGYRRRRPAAADPGHRPGVALHPVHPHRRVAAGARTTSRRSRSGARWAGYGMCSARQRGHRRAVAGRRP
jgi:hypothetical protein